MVLKNVETIMKQFPGILHATLFYNSGLGFQTTFPQSNVNIPELGKFLAEINSSFEKLMEISKFEGETFQKLIFETKNVVVIVVKLGEDSNLALFLEGGKAVKFSVEVIRKHLDRLKELIDQDQADLEEIKQEEAK